MEIEKAIDLLEDIQEENGTSFLVTVDLAESARTAIKAMIKLVAYENTGLTPEEIMDSRMLTGWIPVDERLPDPGSEVLVYIKHNYAEDGWRAYRVYEYTDHWVGMGNLCEVVAWMPLPEPFNSQD